MADNVQKTPIAIGLTQRVTSRVLQHVELMSGRAPASINIKDGKADTDDSHTVGMIKFETDPSLFPLPMVQMPIHGPQYNRPPWQGGEKGYVSTADFDIGGMSALGGSDPAAFVRPANLSALIFHPVGNTDFTPTDDKDSHVQYGKAGTIHRDENKVSQVKTNKDAGVTMSTGGDGSGADGPHNMKATTSGTETNTTATHTTNAPAGHNVPMGPQTVKGDITSSSGNITAATGNISAPSGSMSAPSGNFASGSIGGMSIVGGLIQSLTSGGSSTPLQLDTGNTVMGTPSRVQAKQVTGDTVTGGVVAATKYVMLPSYVLADLLTQYPPTTALAGARVFVTDLINAYAYGTALNNSSTQGGGANGRAMTCDGTVWRVG